MPSMTQPEHEKMCEVMFFGGGKLGHLYWINRILNILQPHVTNIPDVAPRTLIGGYFLLQQNNK